MGAGPSGNFAAAMGQRKIAEAQKPVKRGGSDAWAARGRPVASEVRGEISGYSTP